MFIVNEHGILNGWPNEWPIPAGHRKASEHEIGVFMHTGQQNVHKMPVALGSTKPQAPTRPVETTLTADSGITPPMPEKPHGGLPTQPAKRPAKGKR